MASGLGGRAGAVAATLLLAGCGMFSGVFSDGVPAACPRIAILAEGADLTRHVPGAPRDLTTLTLDARIAGFQARCDWADRGRTALDIRVTPLFEAERGPAAEGRVVDLPWFVALSEPGDGAVIAREAYATRLTFPANAQRAQMPGQAARLALPLAEDRRAGDYVLRLSFQLTPDELALNRQRGPR